MSEIFSDARHFSNAPILLVGTKIDLRNNEEIRERLAKRKESFVTEEEAKRLQTEQNLDGYCEVSALTQENLGALFELAVDVALMPKKKKKESGKCSIL